jgi:hypothetical protein
MCHLVILYVAQPDAMLTKLFKCHGMDVAARVEEVGVRRRIHINEATDPARFNTT